MDQAVGFNDVLEAYLRTNAAAVAERGVGSIVGAFTRAWSENPVDPGLARAVFGAVPLPPERIAPTLAELASAGMSGPELTKESALAKMKALLDAGGTCGWRDALAWAKAAAADPVGRAALAEITLDDVETLNGGPLDLPETGATVAESYIVCLECGEKVRYLPRHLRTRHGLDFEAYAEKWRLPEDYPRTPPRTAKARSDIAYRSHETRRRKKANV